MSLPISFHPAGARELTQAADYYELVREGLGQKFLEAFERTIDQIRRHPEAAPIVGQSVRKALLESRFPYSVLYSIRPAEIRILAVAHHRRRPLYWRRRR